MDGADYEAPRDRKLRHWDELCRTDPKHTKPFTRAGGFRGTAIRPIWNQYRLTEHFGPAGIGWGFERPEYEVVKAEDELLVFCTVRCWYMDDNGERAEIYGAGGDKVLAKQQRGLVSDDEAYKKALTDAIGNAFVRVGLSADVHMGLFEDSKYVAETRAHFSGAAQPEPEIATGARAAQEALRTTRTPPKRPEAAPAPSDARAEATKRYRELQDEIDAATTVPDAKGVDGSLAWLSCARLVAKSKVEEGMDTGAADDFAASVMQNLRTRIEGQCQLLLSEA